MNKKAMTVLTLLAAGAMLTACGGNSSIADGSSAAGTTTVAAETTTSAQTDTTAAKAETTTSAAAPETTAPADTTKAETENAENLPTEDEAKQVVSALGLLDTLYSGGIEKDMESTFKNEAGTAYFKVTDSRFQSAAELRTFVSEHFADSFINSEYSDLLGGDSPLYTDFEGALYGRDMARGGRYSFGNAPAVKVEKANGEGAVVQTEFDDMGAVTKLNISVEKADGVWKITGVNIAD